MNKSQYYTATAIVDKFFNMQSRELADKILTLEEHVELLKQAEKKLVGVFPEYANRIILEPVRDTEDEFAGYRLAIRDEELDETLEFDFGSQGADVI